MCERAAVVCLLLILAIRPLTSETFESIDVAFLAPALAGPTPASTAITDAAALLLSALLLIRGSPSGDVARRTAVLMGLLVASVVVSTCAADDRRVAANAAFSLLASVVAIVALAGALRRQHLIQLALAIALASGVAFAWKCVAQVGWEFRDTRQSWERQQAPDGGEVPAGSDPERVNFERRMLSGEAFGYVSHANLAAACLSTWLLASLGLIAALLATPAAPGVDRGVVLLCATALALLLGSALWFTHSTGALVATVVGAGALLVITLARHLMCQRRVATIAALVGCYVGLMTVGAAWGLSRGTLPHPSLAFRWHYWTAAARAWLDAPLTGVGRANFAAAYLLHKPPENPEEVRDPHNVWVTALVELGPLGLVAIAGLALVWLSASTPRSVVPISAPRAAPQELIRNPASAEEARRSAPFSVASTLACIAGFAAAHAAFSRCELLAAGIVAWWAIETVGVWALGFVLARWLIGSASGPATASWLASGAWAAVLATFIHNLVDFSLFTPSGLAMAGVFMAVAFAHNTVPEAPSGTSTPQPAAPSPSRPRVRAGPLAATAALLLLATGVWLVIVPGLKTEAAMDALHDALMRSDLPHVEHAAAAAHGALSRDAWQSARLVRLARIETQIAASAPSAPDRDAWLHRARSSIDLSLKRSPQRWSAWRARAMIEALTVDHLLAQGDAVGAARAQHAATAAWERAVALYPCDARTRINCADAWFACWEREGAATQRAAATQHYTAALAFDDVFPPQEVKRLSAAQRAHVQARLARLD